MGKPVRDPRAKYGRALKRNDPNGTQDWTPQRLQEFVNNQMDYWGEQSVISGSRRRLMLRRFFDDRPLNDLNCVVITTGEAKRLRPGASRVQAVYPPRLVRLMAEKRLTDMDIDEFEAKLWAQRAKPV
jgi:hypothetical protein